MRAGCQLNAPRHCHQHRPRDIGLSGHAVTLTTCIHNNLQARIIYVKVQSTYLIIPPDEDSIYRNQGVNYLNNLIIAIGLQQIQTVSGKCSSLTGNFQRNGAKSRRKELSQASFFIQIVLSDFSILIVIFHIMFIDCSHHFAWITNGH